MLLAYAQTNIAIGNANRWGCYGIALVRIPKAQVQTYLHHFISVQEELSAKHGVVCINWHGFWQKQTLYWQGHAYITGRAIAKTLLLCSIECFLNNNAKAVFMHVLHSLPLYQKNISKSLWRTLKKCELNNCNWARDSVGPTKSSWYMGSNLSKETFNLKVKLICRSVNLDVIDLSSYDTGNVDLNL